VLESLSSSLIAEALAAGTGRVESMVIDVTSTRKKALRLAVSANVRTLTRRVRVAPACA
jgi:hypothetical protein